MKMIRAILILVTIAAVLVGAGSTLLRRELMRTVSDSNVAIPFVVAPSETLADVSNNLQSKGLITRALAFRYLANSREAASEIYPNTYYFSPNMTMNQILEAMRVPPPPAATSVRFTVPEGLRIEEIAEIIEGTGVVSATEFLDLAKNGAAFKPNYPFLADLPDGASLEGFLFPDTYDIFSNATSEEIIGKMLDTFAIRYAEAPQSPATQGRNVYEIVTMASIVQREASNNEEMPRIAAVFWNRLKPEFAGNILGADPTVQYILGKPGDWWPKLDTMTNDQINSLQSPYNTRNAPGLPAGPISAPGLTALKAAASPANEDITYFLTKCVPSGERPTHDFTNNYDEFLRLQEILLACPK